MNKNLIRNSFWILLIMLACKNTQIKKDYYADGKLGHEYEIKIIDHQAYIDGFDKEFYETGQMKFITFYKKGKRNGAYIEYYSDGKIKNKSFYIDDEREGLDTIFYQNGNIKAIGNYSKGKENGKEKFYYPDGKLQSVVIKNYDTLMYKKAYDSVMLDTVIWRKVWIVSNTDSIRQGTKYIAHFRFFEEDKFQNIQIQARITEEQSYNSGELYQGTIELGKKKYHNGYKIESIIKKAGSYILWGYIELPNDNGMHTKFSHRFVVY